MQFMIFIKTSDSNNTDQYIILSNTYEYMEMNENTYSIRAIHNDKKIHTQYSIRMQYVPICMPIRTVYEFVRILWANTNSILQYIPIRTGETTDGASCLHLMVIESPCDKLLAAGLRVAGFPPGHFDPAGVPPVPPAAWRERPVAGSCPSQWTPPRARPCPAHSNAQDA